MREELGLAGHPDFRGEWVQLAILFPVYYVDTAYSSHVCQCCRLVDVLFTRVALDMILECVIIEVKQHFVFLFHSYVL